jgi:uncharacterized protein (DUF3084 family)
MKVFAFFLPVFLLLVCGCDLQKRENELQKKEAALNQREQQLLLRENALQLKEAELVKKEQQLDSTKRDTAHVINPVLIGRWNVQMTCTETTCAGSAVGDTKNEQWDLAYEGSTLIARAKANEQLVRVYTGAYAGNVIALTNNSPAADTLNQAAMLVRLRIVDETNLEGEREIVRGNQCKIVYAIKMQKQ